MNSETYGFLLRLDPNNGLLLGNLLTFWALARVLKLSYLYVSITVYPSPPVVQSPAQEHAVRSRNLGLSQPYVRSLQIITQSQASERLS